MKGILIKIIPLIGVAIGILSVGMIGKPIASAIRTFLITKFNVSEGPGGAFAASDFKQLMWWAPTGFILGMIAGGIGLFVKGINDTAGNFVIGLGVGFFIGSLIIPFAEDIPFIKDIIRQ